MISWRLPPSLPRAGKRRDARGAFASSADARFDRRCRTAVARKRGGNACPRGPGAGAQSQPRRAKKRLRARPWRSARGDRALIVRSLRAPECGECGAYDASNWHAGAAPIPLPCRSAFAPIELPTQKCCRAAAHVAPRSYPLACAAVGKFLLSLVLFLIIHAGDYSSSPAGAGPIGDASARKPARGPSGSARK